MIQEYDKYTEEDHEVWSLLFNKQIEQVKHLASQAYITGVSQCEFQNDQVPNFDHVNKILANNTGWKIYVVPGLIDNKPFFQHLSRKEFPATTWLRTKQQLDYLEEPDMFHDVFGHVPLLTEPFFCEYLEGLSNIALKFIDNEEAIELLSRIYWFTVEFGLVAENETTKIYGAGILSSTEESNYSINEVSRHRPFDIEVILNTPYIKDEFQEQYFVIENYEQLSKSLPLIERLISSKTLRNTNAA